METTQHIDPISIIGAYRALANDMDALLDRVRADNAKLTQDLAKTQLDRDEWKAEAARLEHLWNDTCEERGAALLRANQAEQKNDELTRAVNDLLVLRRSHRSTAAIYDFLGVLMGRYENTTPITPAPVWIRITQIPEDHHDRWLKIQTIKKVREVANLLLQEAKQVVDAYGWFLVPTDQVDSWRTWAHDNRVRYHVASKPE